MNDDNVNMRDEINEESVKVTDVREAIESELTLLASMKKSLANNKELIQKEVADNINKAATLSAAAGAIASGLAYFNGMADPVELAGLGVTMTTYSFGFTAATGAVLTGLYCSLDFIKEYANYKASDKMLKEREEAMNHIEEEKTMEGGKSR